MKAGVEDKLVSKQINPTSNRMLVLDFMLDQHSAMSLSDIERGLAPTDRVTVYRTLKTFEEKGLVHSIEDGTGIPKYALCVEDCDAERHHDLHVHFYCSQCNETYCLPKTLVPSIGLPDGFKKDEMSLLVKGVCRKCSI